MLVLFVVFLAQMFVSRYCRDHPETAVAIAAAASFSGMGVLFAWAYRRWLLYATVGLMIVVKFNLLAPGLELLPDGMLSIAQVERYQENLLYDCLPMVLPLWGWAVHVLMTIKKWKAGKAAGDE